MEPPFCHLTLSNKSWITETFVLTHRQRDRHTHPHTHTHIHIHIHSLPTNEGKLARNHGLCILFGEKDNHANTMGIVSTCLFIYYLGIKLIEKAQMACIAWRLACMNTVINYFAQFGKEATNVCSDYKGLSLKTCNNMTFWGYHIHWCWSTIAIMLVPCFVLWCCGLLRMDLTMRKLPCIASNRQMYRYN